ncbi:regulator of chromosome condensation 1/beta-lactamase-inhibitor protein II [Tribonema minus]|uniref:Regulator of chromosome condensation 1/beta-lactamase-inhibitor protein II n=1 Tax=Tribonema minus TaxID=303371 RepID=A0A836C7U3_9STRA|nr:regulator of chromosome condensation 1/beta-lactamase-inhibitor protein II [Tribonema minus]
MPTTLTPPSPQAREVPGMEAAAIRRCDMHGLAPEAALLAAQPAAQFAEVQSVEARVRQLDGAALARSVTRGNAGARNHKQCVRDGSEGTLGLQKEVCAARRQPDRPGVMQALALPGTTPPVHCDSSLPQRQHRNFLKQGALVSQSLSCKDVIDFKLAAHIIGNDVCNAMQFGWNCIQAANEATNEQETNQETDNKHQTNDEAHKGYQETDQEADTVHQTANEEAHKGYSETDQEANTAHQTANSTCTAYSYRKSEVDDDGRQSLFGSQHTCAILDDATAKCWGDGHHGQLGQGDWLSLSSPPKSAINLGSGRTAKAIAAGVGHTCALLDNATVKCWGFGENGQLGLGDDVALNSPSIDAINLGLGRTAKAIATGFFHTCALLDDSTVKCWGNNYSGQLGQGTTDDLILPPKSAINLGSSRTATAIAAGREHTCALLDNATVKCGDYGADGQLGQGSTANLHSPPKSVINLGSGRTATAIATGNYHTCALLDNSTVKCWGLGQGTSSPPFSAINLGSGRTAKAIATDDSTAKCWGNGRSGQLGQGSTANLGNAPNEMASIVPVVL